MSWSQAHTPRPGTAPEQGGTTFENTRQVLAAAAVELALAFPEWVRRRKWTFSYVNDTTVRRKQSIDFQLPPPDRFALPPVLGAPLYVPLWLPEKLPLVNLDVRDEEDRALSVLTRHENGPLAALGLSLVIAGDPEARGPAEVNELEDALAAIVTLNPRDPAHRAALRAAEQLKAVSDVLAADDERAALIRDLKRGFLFLVPVLYEPGRDRIVKVAFDTPHLWYGADEKWRERGLGILVALGLADKKQEFPPIEAGWSRSLHLQVSAPPDVELASAYIDASQWDPVTRSSLTRRRIRKVYDQPTADLSVSLRVDPFDFFEPGDTYSTPEVEGSRADRRYRDLLRRRGDTAVLGVHMRPQVRGVFVAAWLVSLLTTPLLWVVKARLANLDGQTSAALLLALPAALAAYLARPGEHAYAARLLVGVRSLALVVGVCSLIAAGVIAAGGIREARAPGAVRVRCAPAAKGSHRGARARTKTAPRPTRTHQAATAQRFDCTVPPFKTPTPGKANATASALVLAATVVATVATGLLSLGFLRTVFFDLRVRGRPDEGVE